MRRLGKAVIFLKQDFSYPLGEGFTEKMTPEKEIFNYIKVNRS